MTASKASELTLPTHCRRRRFSHRATGLPWNLTFAGAAEKSRDGGSSRSRRPSEGLGSFGVERLYPMVTNRRCRPILDTRSLNLVAAKPSSGRRGCGMTRLVLCRGALAEKPDTGSLMQSARDSERGSGSPEGVASMRLSCSSEFWCQRFPGHEPRTKLGWRPASAQRTRGLPGRSTPGPGAVLAARRRHARSAAPGPWRLRSAA